MGSSSSSVEHPRDPDGSGWKGLALWRSCAHPRRSALILSTSRNYVKRSTELSVQYRGQSGRPTAEPTAVLIHVHTTLKPYNRSIMEY